MLKVRRWAARATLALLAVAVLWVLWLLRIHVDGGSMWPFFSGHHPRVLVFVGGVVIWVIVGGAAIAAAVVGLRWLWKEATRDEKCACGHYHQKRPK